jgi:membrane protease YdiL (CAAX protease family)
MQLPSSLQFKPNFLYVVKMNSELPKNSGELKANDGLVCAVAIIILAFVTNEILRVNIHFSPSFADWFRTNEAVAQIILLLIQSCLWILIAFVLARKRSPLLFLNQLGVDSRPTLFGWFAAWLAIGIGFLALYGVWKQWIPQNHFTENFHSQGGTLKWLFVLCAVCLAPLSEEIVMRGFLYHAFRGSYNFLLSVFLVLCVHAYFHWGLISQSYYTFACLVLLEILLCCVREWSGSVWNCFLCHAAYNAIQNLPWYFCLIGLVIFLPYYLPQARRKVVSVRLSGWF